jgi:hypothetical protein
MNWNQAYQYAQSIAAVHGFETNDTTLREDRGLPLNARIGGIITIQKSPFIQAESYGSLITAPDAGDTLIRAISRVNLNLSGKLYRYFLQTGDDEAPENKQEKYLQVLQDAHGNIAEILYCTQLARIVPESAEEQDAYMGLAGAGLGDQSYTLWRTQLAALDVAEADLACAFGDSDRIAYRRDAGNPALDFVAPFTGTETRIDDAAGEHGLEQQLYFMPYARDLSGGREYLLVTTEIVKSRDGDASRRAIHVDFTIGIPLEAERISIQ